MRKYLQSTLEQGDPTTYVALIRALVALLRGHGGPALVDDPELYYMDAVDLGVVFFGNPTPALPVSTPPPTPPLKGRGA